MIRALAVAVAVAVIAPAAARAERDPWVPGTPASSFARPSGGVRVHYVTTTADAVLATDADASGVPDFVEEVADRGDDVLTRLAALGFRAPLPDGVLGGDDRLDLYLQNLAGADGSFDADTCTDTPFHCAGSITIENDFVGYSYPSVSIAIRVLTSHEIFHAVQAAYDADQSVAWSEGSAVWAEERLYPEQDDFERLVAAFLLKPFRPFERPGAGFGDLYPYGAALWPYFLETRFGDGFVRAAWERCEDDGRDPDFLDAIDAELIARGTTLERAWIEFTRWNARTGDDANGTTYPDAARLPRAAREAELTSPGSTIVSIEGLSARYVPLRSLPPSYRVAIRAMRPVAVALRVEGSVDNRAPDGGDIVSTTHDFSMDFGGDAELIITGPSRGGLAQEVMVSVAYAEPEHDAPIGGCCSTGGAPSNALIAALLAFAFGFARRRRRRVTSSR